MFLEPQARHGDCHRPARNADSEALTATSARIDPYRYLPYPGPSVSHTRRPDELSRVNPRRSLGTSYCEHTPESGFSTRHPMIRSRRSSAWSAATRDQQTTSRQQTLTAI